MKLFIKAVLATLAVALTVMPAVNAVRLVSSLDIGKQLSGAIQLADETHPLKNIKYSAEVKTDIKPFSEPVISINFDDGWQSAYTGALQPLEDAGINSTQFIITDVVGAPDYMSLDQIRAFIVGGHEIGSHTLSHPDLTGLDDDQLNQELSESQNYLQDKLGVNVVSFAAPIGKYDERVIAAAKRRYASFRTTDWPYVNSKQDFSPYKIRAFTVRNSTSLGELKKLIAETKQKNGWLILIYHQVDNSGRQFSVSPETFKAQLELVKSSGIKTATLGQFIDSYRRSQ